jgi:hypothetical protein
MNRENVVCLYNEVLFSQKEQENYVLCKKMGELEIILLSELSQSQKDKCHAMVRTWNPSNQKGRSRRPTCSRPAVAKLGRPYLKKIFI